MRRSNDQQRTEKIDNPSNDESNHDDEQQLIDSANDDHTNDSSEVVSN